MTRNIYTCNNYYLGKRFFLMETLKILINIIFIFYSNYFNLKNKFYIY